MTTTPALALAIGALVFLLAVVPTAEAMVFNFPLKCSRDELPNVGAECHTRPISGTERDAAAEAPSAEVGA